MKTHDEILERARETLKTEAEAVLGLIPALDERFVKVVQLIASSKGRVVITGVGKSAIISQKITATLNSTGSPAIFMHAADAIHGDLGIIQSDDIVICISKSGNTAEIKVLVPLLRNGGNTLVAIVGNTESFLAQHADLVLDSTVAKEACPNNLAPTSSTTAQLALGDALAVCLLDMKGFRSEDFARYHPGGALGKKLYLKVGDLSEQNPKPMVSPEDSIQKVIVEISSKRLGAAVVVKDGVITGIITDGDLRRMLEKHSEISDLRAKDIMSGKPQTIEANELAVTAMSIFQEKNINQLVVTDKGSYTGMVHFHDLLREGIL